MNYNLDKACPDNWHYFNGTGSCYKVMKSSKSWDDARSSCQELNSDLASITTEETNTFLASLTTELSWVGGYLDFNKEWKWSDGSVWAYSNWFPGEPNGLTGETTEQQNRATINYPWEKGVDGVGLWDDQYATYKTSFICQLKIYLQGKLDELSKPRRW